MAVHRINTNCNSCELCVDVCPTKSIFYGVDMFVIDSDSCHGCAICVRVCPQNAIFPTEPDTEEGATGETKSSPGGVKSK